MADNELRAGMRWVDFVTGFQAIFLLLGYFANYLDIKIDEVGKIKDSA